VADFKIIAGDAKALVATNRGNIATTLQNFRETSDHLLALSKEVRRAPWRLFATPDKKEVESLNLYDSARAFASAATDIQTCADTLQVMIEARKEGVAVNPDILQGMLKRLEETFARYQEAEKALLKEFERIQK
jgi:formiminotetrahydrofolate cyclodeaminase